MTEDRVPHGVYDVGDRAGQVSTAGQAGSARSRQSAPARRHIAITSSRVSAMSAGIRVILAAVITPNAVRVKETAAAHRLRCG